MADAERIAGEDLRAELAALCPAPRPRAQANGEESYHERTHATIPPTRVFDDLFFVGHTGVGATVLQTTDGLILIDSMTTDKEVEEVLLPGLEQLGLHVADIKYVVVTHGHGDHHGGVQALRRANPAVRVVMSETDWAFSAKPFYMRDGSLDPAPRPERRAQDIGYTGQTRLRLGGTELELIETPGHTPGTTSLLYPLTVGGKRHVVMQWGGGNPTQPVYSEGIVRRFTDRAREAGATIAWSSHARPEQVRKIAAIRAGAAPNPLVYSDTQFGRYLDLILACKAAKAAMPD